MFALQVEYLTGRSVATLRHRREEPEWPPHPGRLFSALAAALHESDLTDDERATARDALLWLEQLPAPAIAAGQAEPRAVIPAFVPVNDVETPDPAKDGTFSAGQIREGLGVLPDGRPKQARFFPTVIPDNPVVCFVWKQADGTERHRPAIERLASCVTYLGHSSSLVHVAVTDAPSAITFEPAGDGRHILRVPFKGRLNELERDFRQQSRPSPGAYASYRRTNEASPRRLAPAESVFGDLVVCELEDGPFLPLGGALKLTSAVRAAILERTDGADPAVKSLVSGHTADKAVSKEDHVAYIPLSNVGHRYGDGKVMGFALVLPRGLGRYSPERRAVMTAVAGLEEIGFAGHSWRVTLVTAGEGPKSLRSWPYTGPSRGWATVTPVLCDRFPKDKDGQRVEDVITDSVERVVGLRPVRVEVASISSHRGVPPSHAFTRERKERETPRHRVHAMVEFDREVRGPLIVGAGRFLGLGLLRVWNPQREARQ